MTQEGQQDISNEGQTGGNEGATENLLNQDLTPQEPEWRVNLPEDLQSHPVIKRAQSVEALAKSLVHAQSQVGADKVVIPGQDADEEAWNDFFAKIGRPEAAEKYEIDLGGEKANEQMVNGFREAAFKAGLNQKQVNELFGWYRNFEKGFSEELNKATQEATVNAVNELKKEFGNEFDSVVGKAQTAARHYENEIPELKELFDIPEVSNHPAMIKFMAKLGEGMTSSEMVGVNQGAPQGFGMSPKEAAEEISRITDDPSHPFYTDKNPVTREKWAKKLMELRQVATG